MASPASLLLWKIVFDKGQEDIHNVSSDIISAKLCFLRHSDSHIDDMCVEIKTKLIVNKKTRPTQAKKSINY